MIKILVVDDHAIVREGLKQIIADSTDMVVAGEAENDLQVFEEVRRQKWDVVLLDINLPGRGGMAILKQLKSERPRLPILILSMHPEDQYAIRTLKAGAAGYVTKESAPRELIAAIRKVAAGGKFITPGLAEKLASGLGDSFDASPHNTLSDREYQVLVMIASGKTPTEIAAELSLSVKTISTYRARILEKMKMTNNAQLTHYAVQNGLV